MKILLIDDSKTMRNIQKAVLGQLGYTDIHEACDGQDALSKVGAIRPDLILVDWNMPNMDGLSFVKAYRQTNKATPMIMVDRGREEPRDRGDQGGREQLRCEAVYTRSAESADQGNAGSNHGRRLALPRRGL